MNEKRKKLQEELEHLKKLIEFHQELKSIIWKGKETEYQDYINAILDHFNELKMEIKKLNKEEKDDRN